MRNSHEMLTNNLLLVKRVGDEIIPQFLDNSERCRLLADQVIGIFEDNLGRPKKELRTLLRELEEESEWDFRVVRGLGSILERQCDFVQASNLNPLVVREAVFKTAAQVDLSQLLESRTETIASVAQELQVSPKEIEDSLYADLEENLELKSFAAPSADRLIESYNLSLAQTLLFKSTRLTLTTGNWKGIFRALRGLGLMYTVTRKNGAYLVTVEGPLSMIRQTTRYGTRLARILPSIVQSNRWAIDAEIMERTRGGRVRHLRLNSGQHNDYLPGANSEPELAFDSDVERDFAVRFMALGIDWELTREPGPLQAGDSVMIPDFVFKKHDVEVYLEIAGFWTPEYLARKLEKTRLLEKVDLILAVDESNICGELGDLPEHVNVVMYKGTVPLPPILKHLKAREKQIRRAHRAKLSDMKIDLQVPSIALNDLAKQIEIDAVALHEHLKEFNLQDYVLLVDILVSKTTLDHISEVIAQRMEQGPLPFSEATELIRTLGGTGAGRILEHLGYRIDWSTLDADEAFVTKVDT